MSFLVENTLGSDISQYIYQFTKPKSIFSYRDVLYLKGNDIIYQFLTSSNNDLDYQTIAYSDPNLFTKNIGYRGYSLFLGCIDLKLYPNVKRSLNMVLVFDEFPLTPIEIIVLDSNNTIVNCYPLKDNLVLSGVLSSPCDFHYDIVDKKKLNTLEIENWNRLIENSSQFANTYLVKHLDNKISISFKYFKSEEDREEDIYDEEWHNHFDGWQP